MTTPRPSRRVAVARLRRLARYLEGLPREEYDQGSCRRCALGHARKCFQLANPLLDLWCPADYLGVPEHERWPLFSAWSPVDTPAGKAKQLRALAARLDGER